MSKRAVLVGAGGMGRAWVRTLSASHDVELCAWVDRDEHVLSTACRELELAPSYCGTDLGEALSLRPDMLVDVTTPESHCEVTIRALEAGIPVLGEKPMASSMAEAQSMVAAADKAGRLYMVSQSRRYNRGLHSYQKLIQSLGGLGVLNAAFYLGPHFGGFRDEMPSPLLLDMAIHTFDASRFLSSADPVSIYAEEFNPAWSWYAGNASATAIFEMTDGLRFTYCGSWCAEGFMTSWESEWRAVCAQGTAIWDGNQAPVAERFSKAGGFFSECVPLIAEPSDATEGIEGSLKEFLTALDTRIAPNGECHDNIKSLAMVFGAIESSRRGRRVALREIL